MNRLKWTMIAAVAALAALGGCTVQQQAHLEGELTRRDIYLHLMTPEQATQFRLMEKEERDQEQIVMYCQVTGVYQKWRAVPPQWQALIRQGRVVEGMSPDEVQMAWGRPAATEDATSAAEREGGHLRRLWKFDPTADKEGNPVYAREVCFLDEKALWFKDFRDTAAGRTWKWNWFGLKK